MQLCSSTIIGSDLHLSQGMTDSFDFLSWTVTVYSCEERAIIFPHNKPWWLARWHVSIATDAVSVLKASTVTHNRNCWQCHHLYKGNNCKRLPFSLAGQELVCSRIAWLFVRSVGFHHARNSLMHDNGWWLPPSGHIHKTRRNTFPDQGKRHNWSTQAFG